MLWVFVVLSIALSAYAILRRSWRWMLVSAVFFLPFVAYLSATPGFRGAIFVLPFHLAAAYLLHRGHRAVAWLMLAPGVLLAVWVALLVVFQPVP